MTPGKPEQRRAGMGGAGAVDDPFPFLPSEVEKTVYGEILEEETEVSMSVSRSDGVGFPLHDPAAAVRQIEEDPESIKPWWPPKAERPAAPPPASPVRSLMRIFRWLRGP